MLVELDQSTFIGWMMETSGRPLEVYHKGKGVGSLKAQIIIWHSLDDKGSSWDLI